VQVELNYSTEQTKEDRGPHNINQYENGNETRAMMPKFSENYNALGL